VRIIDCEQLSEQWWRVRRGVPTASRFDSILTPKTMKPAAAQQEYIHELIADTVRLSPVWTTNLGRPMTPEMQFGVDTEPEARAWYEMERGLEARRVGFITTDDGRFGCSPDGLTEEGGVEIKCPSLKTQVRYLLEGGLPPEYRCQLHGTLIVTGRPWWDFCSYATGLPALLVRVEPDAFTEALAAELDRFRARYDADLSKILALLGPVVEPPAVVHAPAAGHTAGAALEAAGGGACCREVLARVAAAASNVGVSLESVAAYCRRRGWTPDALTEAEAEALLDWLALKAPGPQ
jgi:hypothetical protein